MTSMDTIAAINDAYERKGVRVPTCLACGTDLHQDDLAPLSQDSVYVHHCPNVQCVRYGLATMIYDVRVR